MYKLAILATLGFAASAQFLSNTRDLQGYNGTIVTAPFIINAACTTTATSDSCPQNYCCASLRRSTAAAPATFTTVSGTFCAPVEFNATLFNVSGAINSWTCANQVNANSFRTANLTLARKACSNDTECEVGTCCATITDFFGTSATAVGQSATRRFCVDGTKGGIQLWGNYTAAAATAVGTGSFVQISQGSCTNNVAPVDSFGAYIKASLMMVAAVLSVAFF